jgi:hypothetical protein
MRPVIALFILGSIVTSASAAGTEMHELASEHAFSQQQSAPNADLQDAFSAADGHFRRGAPASER